MNQRERVLAVLRNRGGHGLCQLDFFAPNVCDGGEPITRIAARIEELRDAGYVITSAKEDGRGKCSVYVLVREPAAAAHHLPSDDQTPRVPAPQALFDTAPTFAELRPQPRSAIYEDEEAA